MFKWFKKKNSSNSENENGLDYSKIDSNEKAIELFKKGELTELHLMPLEFGGQDIPMNILYVPEFAKMFKLRFDKMIEELLIDGEKLSYSAEPEYKGNSFIPSKLKIMVTGDSEFVETINIW
ncbi:hypothetical protein [Tenacibaculum sp. M341]|uniref:hypothetical protein n=1 Tax=Tenacibaculum sp. M341 TaxID=2530339 RepID=UPI001051EB26|nr:hypothetical protein [Tenacibaculum sp. M341]TCI90952.1 hypothetical protein EYW44_11405 [Tenacibaculum sp. M341]